MKVPLVLPYLMQSTAWIILKYITLRNTLEIRGIKNLQEALSIHKQKHQGIVFASNHISELDPALIFMGMSPFRRKEFPTYYVASEKQTFKSKRFGWRRFIYGGIIFHISGAFPIKQNRKNYEEALGAHIAVLKAGYNVCIFPEGKMARDGIRGKARGGVMFMAEYAESPIVPIAITRNKHAITVEYLPLLWPSEIISPSEGDDRYRKAAEEIMSRIDNANATHA